MSYLPTSGVQSAPRVMRGPPVQRPNMFDMPLVERDLGAASDVVAGMSRTTMMLAAVAAVALVFYLRKGK